MKILLAAVLLVAACAAPAPSLSPAPSPSVASPLPDVSLSVQSGASATGCPDPRTEGTLPFDRLVRVEIGQVPGADVVTFAFDPPFGPAARTVATLEPASPPFVEGGSGLSLEVEGDAFVSMKFQGVILSDDGGQPTLTTPSEYRPLLPVVRHVVNSEAFEGISRWLIGYEGQTCVVVTTDLGARVIRLAFTYAVRRARLTGPRRVI